MADKAHILKQTHKLIAKGQIDKAIQLWEVFVDDNPDGAIYNTIGDLCLKKNDKQNAMAWFHKAAKFIRNEGFSLKALAIYKKILNIDRSDPHAILALGELNEEKGLVPDAIKFYLASIDAMGKRGQKDKVIDIYNKILNLAPSNLPLRTKIVEFFIKEGFNRDASKELVYIARLYEEKGESRTAVEYFNKALTLYPQNRDAYLSMSKLYETLGKKDRATQVLKKAVEAFPEDSELRLRFADYLIKENAFDEAIDLVKQVAEKEPDNVSVKERIANIHLMKGNKEKAWSIYGSIIGELHLMKKPEHLADILREFVEIDPVEVGKQLSYIYKESGDSRKAFDEFISVGRLLKDKGMAEEALNILNEARQINPEDEEVNGLIVNLKKEIGIDHISLVAEKSTDEATTEAEIFLRYGLTEEALKILESLKSKEPENIDIHRKLKTLYLEMGDKELAVTECLVLANLLEKEGNNDKKEQVLQEAFDIDPNDPRLLERSTAVKEDTPLSPADLDKETGGSEQTADALAEADFYFRQGLTEEALAIYRQIQQLMPDNEEIKEKIAAITSPEEIKAAGEAMSETAIGDPSEEFASEGLESILEDFGEPSSPEEISAPTLENDVLEIFEEFKKGIASELDEEDSETHYNLGIAYKEMGLIDDAIKEFQTVKKDPKKLVEASSMLGICYMEKGLYPLAIEAMKNALEHIKEKDDSYWGTKYDLAEAYQKNGNIKEAFALYTEIYAFDSKFRNVDKKVNSLKDVETKTVEPATGPKKKKDRISYI